MGNLLSSRVPEMGQIGKEYCGLLAVCTSFPSELRCFLFLKRMEIIFLGLVFVIAFLYASVGHGGASGYLAIMVLFGMSPLAMRSSVLVLNIMVSGTAFFQYYRGRHFSTALLWPFVITSIPMALLGSLTPVHLQFFRILLMICLLAGVFRLIYDVHKQYEIRPISIPLALIVGGIIGYISGMIGIGGGILLSPIILLFRWGTPKEVAAVSAPFILLNSIAGLLGTWHNQTFVFNHLILAMWITAISGGFLGAFMGSFRWNHQVLKYVLALILLIASFKLVV